MHITGPGVRVRINLITAVLFFCTALPIFAQTSDPAFQQLKSYLFGRDSTALDKITALVASSRSNPTERAAVASELASVLTSTAAFDAKQFACRQLVFVAGEPEIPALSGLLSDEKLCHYALMALAKIPGKAVNDAVFSHVNAAKNNNRVEILCLLADRNDKRAEAGLVDALRHENSSLGRAAISGLLEIDLETGQIADDITGGTPVADMNDASFLDGYLQLGYRDRARGDLKDAQIWFRTDSDNLIIRAADLRGLVLTSTNPVPLIVKALGEDGTPRQKMAAEIVDDVPGSAATRAFAKALPDLTPRGQMLLLTALGNRGDRAAAAGVMAECKSIDSPTKLAALKALGQVGDATAITLLLTTAANGTALEKETARQSLNRLKGAGIDEAIRIALEDTHATEAVQIEAINAVLGRHIVSAWTALAAKDTKSTPKIREASFKALGEIAPNSSLTPIVIDTIKLPTDERDSALEACIEIARRGTTEKERTGDLLRILGNEDKPANKLTLLSILNQVGGPAALQALEKAQADPNTEVSSGALAMIADWPTDEPMDLLLRTIRAPGGPRRKTIALRGYLRMIGSNDQRPPDTTLALYKSVSSIAQRPEDKRQILSGIAKLHTLSALQFASSLSAEADTKAEAEISEAAIGRSTIGAYPTETRDVLQPIAASGTDEAAKKLAAEVLSLPPKAADYIIAWEVSPAYHQDGVDYTRLFDMPFAPEIAGKEKDTPWILMPVVTNPEQPWLLDLLALWGGEQRVAYLRTAVNSDTARDLTLELGSDDGVKAWLNGVVILADNTQRGVTPGQEKVKVHLNAGWNILLLKVTQNVLGWGACARFAAMDGSPVTGLKYSVPSAIK